MTLLWNNVTSGLDLDPDLANDEQRAVLVPEDRALDAFNHPYVYLAA